MLTKRDRAQKFKALEFVRRNRMDNLRSIRAQLDITWADFGRLAGVDPTMLISIAGPNPRRSIGEVLARDLERRLKLASGYLDQKH